MSLSVGPTYCASLGSLTAPVTPSPPLAQIAAALQAEKLVLMTDVPGVLRDKNDVKTKFASLNIRECRTLIGEGVIAGGMIPKVCASAFTLSVPLSPWLEPMPFLHPACDPTETPRSTTLHLCSRRSSAASAA